MIKNIGILGGGQLGRMLAIACHQYGLVPHIYTDKADSPATFVTSNYTVADYKDIESLENFAKKIDVVTFEFENLPYESLETISKYAEVIPRKEALKIAQNRIAEKDFLCSLGIEVADYCIIKNSKDLYNIPFDYPAILKTATLGYDGKGQKVLQKADDLPKDFMLPAVLERCVKISKEVSMVVAKNEDCIRHFPIATNMHQDGILITSDVPSIIETSQYQTIVEIADLIANNINLKGILAIEFFIEDDGKILVNELAPRPHNSAHWSMDCCNISQFDALVRIVANMPLPEIILSERCTMHNIIGHDLEKAFLYLKNPRAKLHIYGKSTMLKGRKMGHVNIMH